MKIKMTTSAVKIEPNKYMKIFENGKTYTVGIDIEESIAKSFLKGNFAIEVKEVEEKLKKRVKKKATEEGAE